jgi:hypothetical protein
MECDDKASIDRIFLDAATHALAAANTTALVFLRGNPRDSKIALAQRLGHGVSALGLLMAIYESALKADCVREVAYDLLLRQIIAEFPHGWASSVGNVRASVLLGGWAYDLSKCLGGNYAEYAQAVLIDLCGRDQPETGWIADYPNDQKVRAILDRCWPANDAGHT